MMNIKFKTVITFDREDTIIPKCIKFFLDMITEITDVN